MSFGAAEADCPTTLNPADFASPPIPVGGAVGLDGFSVEGKITAIQTGTFNTIATNGAMIVLPPFETFTSPVLVNTQDPRVGTRFISLLCLDNPLDASCATFFRGQPVPNNRALPGGARGFLPAIGGTLKATGEISPITQTAACRTMVAQNAGVAPNIVPGVTFEFSENLLIGVFDYVAADPASGTPLKLLVNGAEFRMNEDPRVPFYSETAGVVDDGILTDISGEPIRLADLTQPQFRGSLIAVTGFYGPTDTPGVSVLWATSVESEAFRVAAGGDTVIVERAQYTARTRAVRIDGIVQPQPGVPLPPTVAVFVGTAVSGACISGAPLPAGSAVPVAADGTFSYRRTNVPLTTPGTLCAQSPRGGADDLAIVVR